MKGRAALAFLPSEGTAHEAEQSPEMLFVAVQNAPM